MQNQQLQRHLGLWTAILVVIASMIGVGIFGNTGIIQMEVRHPLLVLGLWLLGGLIALSGALVYAELATMMPHAGGEYVYLKKSYGLLPSFLTGWVSFIVGFSAPAASAALLSSEYAHKFLIMVAPASALTSLFEEELYRKLYAVLLILLFSLFHSMGVKKGGMVQNVLSFAKLFFISMFAVAGLAVAFLGDGLPPMQQIVVGREADWSGFGVGLLFVMFAYSGWNGATYLAEEIKDPDKNLPRALLMGTTLTIVLYMMLNLVYYLAVPVGELEGQEAVAAVAAGYLFGNNVTVFFNLAFCLMLLSSLSVSIMIGPRVYYAMARDKLFFKAAGRVDPRFGTPMVSISIQAFLAILYVLTGKYDQILAYMGFALSIFPVLTVFGLIYLRKTHPHARRPYQTPLFPLVPLFFIGFSLVIMVTSFLGRPVESSIALAVVLLGIPIYFLWSRFSGEEERVSSLEAALEGEPGRTSEEERLTPRV